MQYKKLVGSGILVASLALIAGTLFQVQTRQDVRQRASSLSTGTGSALQQDVSEKSQLLKTRKKNVQGFSLANQDISISELKEIAKDRKKLLKKLMRENPQAAVEMAFTENEQKKLPEEVAQEIEKTVVLDGVYHTAVADIITPESIGNISAEYYDLLETTDKKTYFLHFADKNIKRSVKSKVRVKGINIDEDIVIPQTSDSFSVTETTTQGAQVQAVTSPQFLAIIPFKFAGRPYTLPSTATLSDLVFTRGTGVNAFYKEQSGNQYSFTGQVYEPVTISADPLLGCNPYGWKDQVNQALANSGISIPANSFKVYMWSEKFCLWGGIGGTDGNAFINNWFGESFATYIISHELGHVLGFDHAIKDIAEYGDCYDVMGGLCGDGSYYPHHMHAQRKTQAGWLPTTAIKDVTASGVYKLNSYATPYTSGQTKALRIKKDIYTSYYIEYRQNYGAFDQFGVLDLGPSGITVYEATSLLDTPTWQISRLLSAGGGFRESEGLFQALFKIKTPDYIDLILKVSNIDPIGFHEHTSCTLVTGWTCDRNDYAKSLDVEIYKDSKTPENLLGTTKASNYRPDLLSSCGQSGSHGFGFNTQLDPSRKLFDGQPHKIYAYAINEPIGNNPQLSQIGDSATTVTCAVPTGTLSANPNQCTIPWNDPVNACATTISWNAQNTPGVSIKIGTTDADLHLWTSQGPSGSLATDKWVEQAPKGLLVVLYARNGDTIGQELARIRPTALKQAPLNYTLTGTVFHDVNKDGIAQAGDTPHASVVVSANTGQTVATNAQGVYSMTLPAGTYTITPAAGDYGNTPKSVVLDSNKTLNFGLNRTTIRGIVFKDNNNNGGFDTGEQVTGVTMNLSGAQTKTTTVGSDGFYIFSGLTDGNYAVTAQAPTGYSITGQNPFTFSLAAQYHWINFPMQLIPVACSVSTTITGVKSFDGKVAITKVGAPTINSASWKLDSLTPVTTSATTVTKSFTNLAPGSLHFLNAKVTYNTNKVADCGTTQIQLPNLFAYFSKPATDGYQMPTNSFPIEVQTQSASSMKSITIYLDNATIPLKTCTGSVYCSLFYQASTTMPLGTHTLKAVVVDTANRSVTVTRSVKK